MDLPKKRGRGIKYLTQEERDYARKQSQKRAQQRQKERNRLRREKDLIKREKGEELYERWLSYDCLVRDGVTWKDKTGRCYSLAMVPKPL